MKKYWRLFILSWQSGFVYRTSLLMWRLRQVLSTVMALTVWSVLFTSADTTSLFGYDRAQMVTYIFLIGILQSFILATSLQGLSNTIYSGSFSFDLLKPVRIFPWLFSQDMGDKTRNILFIFIETALLFFVFRPEFTIPSLGISLLFILWLVGGVMLHFFIQLIFGAIGFWSPETWGPRFLFYMFVDFTAGKLFPLDILPLAVQQGLALTPFPYLSFWQSQLFLGKLTPEQVIIHSIGLIVWTLAIGILANLIWIKGIKNYSASGQ